MTELIELLNNTSPLRVMFYSAVFLASLYIVGIVTETIVKVFGIVIENIFKKRT